MPDDRLPKRCYKRLLELDGMNGLGFEYIWVSQVGALFAKVGFFDVWEKQNSLSNKELGVECNKVIVSWKNNIKSLITEKYVNSSYSHIYRHLSQLNTAELNSNIRVSFHKIRVLG